MMQYRWLRSNGLLEFSTYQLLLKETIIKQCLEKFWFFDNIIVTLKYKSVTKASRASFIPYSLIPKHPITPTSCFLRKSWLYIFNIITIKMMRLKSFFSAKGLKSGLPYSLFKSQILLEIKLLGHDCLTKSELNNTLWKSDFCFNCFIKFSGLYFSFIKQLRAKLGNPG